MVKVETNNTKNLAYDIPKELLVGKRHLTKAEIEILEKNLNHNDDETWNNFYVSDYYIITGNKVAYSGTANTAGKMKVVI